MDIMDAMKAVGLMKRRDHLLTMRSNTIERENQGWSLLFNDNKIPISKEDKRFFREAIDKAIDQVETEIKKL